MATSDGAPRRFDALRKLLTSRRLGAVALLSFSSGFPLGVVWFAIPTWLKQEGVDIRVVGLFTLAQAPWSFKVLWSPLMDRYPLPFLGRKRGWILASQIALVGLGLWLAGVSRHPDAVWVIGAVTLATAFASATHDIAYDAYTVEVLRTEEHGLAVGARTALYRAAMLVSGGVAITLASSFDVTIGGRLLFHWAGSWPLVNLIMAACYLPLMLVTLGAPEPESLPEPPRSLREAVWGPFLSLLAQHRALEILGFVVLYKLGDNLTQALTRPFLVEVGFNPFDVGVATATIGQVAAISGTFLGAVLTPQLGLGRSLWIFGFLQIFSNLGYAAVAQVGVNRPLMYAAQAFEHVSSGLGSGAFGVLLLRLTQKRFSATQFALLSSLFTIPRVLAGPPAGYLAATIGWRDFFILTVFTGVPGMMMLARFVPWGTKEPQFNVEEPSRGEPLSRWALVGRASLGGFLSWLSALLLMAGMAALGTLKSGTGLQWGGHVQALLAPQSLGGWLTALGILLTGLFGGLATGAVLVARRGLERRPAVAG